MKVVDPMELHVARCIKMTREMISAHVERQLAAYASTIEDFGYSQAEKRQAMTDMRVFLEERTEPIVRELPSILADREHWPAAKKP